MYIDTIFNGDLPEKIFESDRCGLSEAEEYVMLKLRLSQGVSESEFCEKFGTSLIKSFPNIEKFLKSGHMEKGD